MYLHEDKETFRDLSLQVSKYCGRTSVIVEKDYYVTLILRQLSEQLNECVLKGGTSLSKGYHVIDRFSEDIDITFTEHLGESRRKKLKNVVLKGISEELELPIADWNEIQSDRDYNAYHFSYSSVFDLEDDRVLRYVKLETALGSYSFPTQTVEIHNYIGDFLELHHRGDLAEQFTLGKFSMKLQSLERTYIDKIFALCDYYLTGRSKRYSRHLYDIYKLDLMLSFDNSFQDLVKEVREHRSALPVCPSALPGEDIGNIITRFCDEDYYKKDYQEITSYFMAKPVPYEKTIDKMREIVRRGLFN